MPRWIGMADGPRNGKWLSYIQRWSEGSDIGCVNFQPQPGSGGKAFLAITVLSRSLQSRIAVFNTQDGSPDKKQQEWRAMQPF